MPKSCPPQQACPCEAAPPCRNYQPRKSPRPARPMNYTSGRATCTRCSRAFSPKSTSCWTKPSGSLRISMPPMRISRRGCSEQFVERDRQFPHANTRGVVHRSGNGGGHAGQADLADAARAKFINLFVGEVEEMHVDRGHVGVHGHYIVGEVTVDRRAALRIVRRVLEQRHADSHHHRALDLVPAG